MKLEDYNDNIENLDSSDKEYVRGVKFASKFFNGAIMKAKKEAYEQGFNDGLKHTQILMVGDVVTNSVVGEYVITHISDDGYFSGVTIEDGSYFSTTSKHIQPTNRHIPLEFIKTYRDRGYQE